MLLNQKGLCAADDWKRIGVTLPAFDRCAMQAHTEKHPVWVHFGAGNIFRGFIANLQQTLLNKGLAQSGIIAVDTFDYDIIDRIYAPFDNLTLLVSLKPDATTTREIVASVAKALRADPADAGQMGQLRTIFADPGLQMVSFTITEKGYALSGLNGERTQMVREDLDNGPDRPRHAMSILTALMLARYQAGAFPIALVSMDNCSHNGEKLRSSVLTIARGWSERGFVPAGFVQYLEDEARVSFPWSMIDKITPRPDEGIARSLAEDGIEGMQPIVTSRNTYIAPFVNTEVPQYLVIEDRFPNGRPSLEQAGVYMTDRDTVNLTERMKVCTCLNPLHTALAVYGCLLGYKSIAREMQDPDLKRLVERIGYVEGLPVVADPGILNPETFLREVIEQRLPNPFIPDAPQRIATDTSQKVPIRFGETIKAYVADASLDLHQLIAVPLVIAGWMRYLLAVDDAGGAMPISADPMAEALQAQLAGISFDSPASYQGQLRNILNKRALFGSDLCALGMAEQIEAMFCEMLAGPGSVRATLKKHLASDSTV
ncbi:mannitol dehydrogenase family protein [Ruthenibacterium sp.]|uniref:mannitol dehydrogenase family protein n=1 Tax=Ruthenibacterium sp. TaxID=1905345 RepID=UPI002579B947|nr:mannitol dehydrogenase family protein [Ruthenibacterium sp.]MBQ1358940.1 mannitol dehydrogenase family protein [Ruthenibacterium sp.]